jgi:hypothetical protein
MNDKTFSLPDLISSLGNLENGRGMFSKKSYDKISPSSVNLSKSLSLRPSSGNLSAQQGMNKKPKSASVSTGSRGRNPVAEVTTAYSQIVDINVTENQGTMNSYQKLMTRAQSNGFEEDGEEGMEVASSPPTKTDNTPLPDIEIPEHILQFKKDWEEVQENRLRLPLLRQLSPRSRKKASLLPPPNAREIAKLSEYEKLAKSQQSPFLYKELSGIARKEQIKMYQSGGATSPLRQQQRNEEGGSVFKKPNQDVLSGEKKEIAVLQTSTAVYDDVKARRARKLEQQNRVSVFATPEDGFSDASSSVTTKRPISPKVKAYPFQTELAKMVSSADHKQTHAAATPVAAGSLGKGRKPPSSAHPSSSSPPRQQRQQQQEKGQGQQQQEKGQGQQQQEKGQGQQHQEQDNILQREYIPLLQELTSATNELLQSYGTVAKEYNDQSHRTHQQKKENTLFLNSWKSSLLEELGVDVDPVYNARVKYGRAVTMLIYYTVTMKLKFALGQWKHFTTETNRRRRLRAGELLVRIGRGMLSRREVRERRWLHQQQREAEEEYERQRMIFRSFMAYKITKVWKRYQKRKQRKLRDRRRRACVLIQTTARGMLARAHVRWLRSYRQQCLISSIKIQCAYRIHLAKRKVCSSFLTLSLPLLCCSSPLSPLSPLLSSSSLPCLRSVASATPQT